MMSGNDKGNFRFLLEDVLEYSNAETRYRICEAYDKALARAEAAEAQTRLTEIELEHTIQALDNCQDELATLRAQLEEALRCDRIHTSDYETTARQLRDCRDDLKTVIDRAEDTTRHAAALAAEVARLTAENAALRAQLDAATAWRAGG
jgi:predicted  nucleic acid-binding Zn-ribbon protein